MTPDKSLRTLFDAALELEDAAERARFLDEACGANAALRERIGKLLRAHDDAGGFLSHPSQKPPGADGPQAEMLSPLTEKPGDKIGHYKLLQQIGEGGCGVVYMAEQEDPVHRRVAFKIVKLGMDTKQVVARFEAERQALALMDHPNIARVLDAGATESGRPFFVMELVRGVKITEFCDQQKLTTRGRLQLFVAVCQAVQHAHQKGIIHRDLKPSNILVTMIDGTPVPKVIDFGIAKATTDQRLTDKTVFTAFEQFIGTPAYMSPEQAGMSGVDIDTRTDIYSLGVVLYELLTGKTPFDSQELGRAGIDEIRRTIREQEPAKPSTRLRTLAQADLTTAAKARQTETPKLISLVQGDLDWVVMKCLEKDRSRRYETANGLAMDIRRHLQNEPVLACPPGAAYRFGKVVQRNKVLVSAVIAVAAALVAGLGIAFWQYAEKSAAYSRTLTAEKQATVEAARSRQVAHFLKEMLAGVGPAKALGRDTTMLKEILVQTRQRMSQELTNQPEVEMELRDVLADTYMQLGDFREMESVSREAVNLALRHPAIGTMQLGNALRQSGSAAAALGRLSEGEATLREALAMQQQGAGSTNLDVASTLTDLGDVLMAQGKRRETAAEECYRRALEIRKQKLGLHDPSVGFAIHKLAFCLRRQSKLLEAGENFRQALTIIREHHHDQPNPEEAYLLGEYAWLLYRQGHYDEAEATFKAGLAMRRLLFGHEHPDVGVILNDYANVFLRRNKLAEAEEMTREAVAIKLKHFGNDHPEIVVPLTSLAAILKARNKLEEAEGMARQALAVQRRVSPVNEDVLANVLGTLGVILIAREHYAEAEPLAREAVAIRASLARVLTNDFHLSHAQAILGSCLLGQKRYAEAQTLLLPACHTMQGLVSSNPATLPPALRSSIGWLIRLLEETGQIEAAAEWKGKLASLAESTNAMPATDTRSGP